jgi:hypothetical protein
MMMKMLEAGGVPPLTDRVREADADNPQGYYEFERVKQLEEDQAWLPEARGKAVKIILALLKHLPPGYRYKIIFMRRNMEEILASQKKMLVRRGQPTDTISDERMAQLFEMHLQQGERWLAQQSHMDVLYVSYNDVLSDPTAEAERVDQFLSRDLNIKAMVEVVDSALYRQRKG